MIRVEINFNLDQPVHYGIRVLEELRAAGIPMVGVLWPVLPENGRLSVATVDGKTVYEWEGEEVNPWD